jgi:hypothetical protein
MTELRDWANPPGPIPAGIPEGFNRLEYDSSNWAEITMPSNWQLQGFSDCSEVSSGELLKA